MLKMKSKLYKNHENRPEVKLFSKMVAQKVVGTIIYEPLVELHSNLIGLVIRILIKQHFPV